MKNFNTEEPQSSVRSNPFSPWPFFAEDEVEAVAAVLRSGKVNYWTGHEGREFEKEFAEYVNCSHAIALSNGTAALELALFSIGIGPGDEVITTCRTFIASASCIVMRGAIPVLADVDSVSQNITVDTIRPLISKRTKAIICVHLAGWPCDMDSIMDLAREHGLSVIEDCAQAHGATYKGQPVGSFGDVAAFSFCQDKIITTGGEGGMLTTNNETLWRKAWEYKDHGKNYDAVFNCQHPPGFRWLHTSFGTNLRLTEMQSAIGRSQLRKLPDWVAARRKNAAILSDGFSKIPQLRVTVPFDEIDHAYYKYYVFLRPEMFLNIEHSILRDEIMNAIVAEGIPCFSGSCSEIYREKAFISAGYGPQSRHVNARDLGETSLMFLVHPTLTDEDMVSTVNAVKKILFVMNM